MSYKGPRIRATKTPDQYPYMQYPYQNVGTQLTWRGSAPASSRQGAATSLGLGGTLEYPSLPLPGGPEIIPADSGYSGVGDCGGNCGKPCCGTAMMEMGAFDAASIVKPVAVAAGAYLLYKLLTKKRR